MRTKCSYTERRRHGGLHVRQDRRGGAILWCVATESLEGPRFFGTRLHVNSRRDRPPEPSSIALLGTGILGAEALHLDFSAS